MDMATESHADHVNICLTVQENIFKLTNIFRSMLPSSKHVLIISCYAVQIQTVVAPISSTNQYKRSFSRTTTAKLTCSSQFSIQLHYWSQQKGKEVHEDPISHRSSSTGSTGHPRGTKPHGHPSSLGSLPYTPPHRQAPTSVTL